MLSPIIEQGIAFGDGLASTNKNDEGYRSGLFDYMFWRVMDRYNAVAEEQNLDVINRKEAHALRRQVLANTSRGRDAVDSFMNSMNTIVGPRVRPAFENESGPRMSYRFELFQRTTDIDGVPRWFVNYTNTVTGQQVRSRAGFMAQGFSAAERNRYAMEHMFFRAIDDYNSHIPEEEAARRVKQSEATRLHDEVFLCNASGAMLFNTFGERMNRIVGTRLGFTDEHPLFDAVADAQGQLQYMREGTRMREYFVDFATTCYGTSNPRSWDFTRRAGETYAPAMSAGLLLSPYDERVRDRHIFAYDDVGTREVFISADGGVLRTSDIGHESLDADIMKMAMATQGYVRTRNVDDPDVFDRIDIESGSVVHHAILDIDDVSGLSSLRRWMRSDEYENVAPGIRRSWEAFLREVNTDGYDFRTLGVVDGTRTSKMGLVESDGRDGVAGGDPAAHLTPEKARENYFEHLQVTNDRAAAICSALRNNGFTYNVGFRSSSRGVADEVVCNVEDFGVDVRLIDRPLDINFVGRTYDRGSGTTRYVVVEQGTTMKEAKASGAEFAPERSVRDGFWAPEELFVTNVMYSLGVPQYVDRSRLATGMNPQTTPEHDLLVGHYSNGYVREARMNNGRFNRAEELPRADAPGRSKDRPELGFRASYHREASGYSRGSDNNVATNVRTWKSSVMLGKEQFPNTDRPNEPFMIRIRQETSNEIHRENFFTKPHDGYAYRWLATAVSSARDRFEDDVNVEEVWRIAQAVANEYAAYLKDPNESIAERTKYAYPNYDDLMPTEILAVDHGVSEEIGQLRSSYFKFMVDAALYQQAREDPELGAYFKTPRFTLAQVVGHNDPLCEDVAAFDEDGARELVSTLANGGDILDYVKQHFEATRDIMVGTVCDREGRDVHYERVDYRGDFVRGVEGVTEEQRFSGSTGELTAVNGTELDAESTAALLVAEDRRERGFDDDVITYDATNVATFMVGRQFGQNRLDLINCVKSLSEDNPEASEAYPAGALGHIDQVSATENTNNFTPNMRFADATLSFGQRRAVNMTTGLPEDGNRQHTYGQIMSVVNRRLAAGQPLGRSYEYVVSMLDAVRDGVESSMFEMNYVTGPDGQQYPDISVDQNGVVHYVARRRFEQGTRDAELNGEATGTRDLGQWIEGEIGQLFLPRPSDGLIETRFMGSENFRFAMGMQGYVLDQVDHEGSFEERVRVLTFDETLRRHIRKQIREDLSIPNITAGIGTASSLNSVYRNYAVSERISRDAREMALLQGMPEGYVEAIEQTHMRTVSFMGGFEEDANVSAEHRKSQQPYYLQTYDMTSNPLDVAGRALSHSDRGELAYFDLVGLGMAKKQSGKRTLNEGVVVNSETGELTPSSIDDKAPLMKLPVFEFAEHDAWNRQQMPWSNVMHGLGVDEEPVGAAYMTVFYTDNDAVPVSREYAEAHMVLDAETRQNKVLESGDYVYLDENGGLRAVDKSEIEGMRSQTRGDKLSDAHGNKGVIARVYDRNATEEEMAEMSPLDRKITEMFKANPGDAEHGVPRLDVIMSPHAAVSRLNAGTAREAMSFGAWDLQGPGMGETRVDARGNEFVTGAGGLTMIRTITHDKTADTKTALTNGKGRNLGWQSSTVLGALGAQKTLDMAYLSNEKGMRRVREMLRTGLGLDMDTDGKLSETLLQRSDEEVRVFDAVDLSRYPARRRMDSVEVEFGDWATSGAGYVELPFPLRWPERKLDGGSTYEQYLETASHGDSLIEGRADGPVDRKGNHKVQYYLREHEIPRTDAGTWHMPLMAAQERVGSRSVDGSLVNHDYTQRYNEIVKCAVRWYEADIKRKQAEQDVATFTEERDRVLANYGGDERRIPKGERKAYDTTVKKLEKAEDTIIQQARRRDHAERSAQSQFEQLSNEIYDKRLNGRYNDFKQSIECAPVRGDSATAIWSPDPNLDFHTLGMGPALAAKLHVKDGDIVGMWRDPMLEMSNILGMRVKVMDEGYGGDTYGVVINPELATPIAGDFDGDTVGVIAPHDRDTQEELMDRACIERALVNPVHKDHKLTLGNSTELRCAYAHHPEFKERYDELCRRAREVYDTYDCRDEGDPYTQDVENLSRYMRRMYDSRERSFDFDGYKVTVEVMKELRDKYLDRTATSDALLQAWETVGLTHIRNELIGISQNAKESGFEYDSSMFDTVHERMQALSELYPESKRVRTLSDVLNERIEHLDANHEGMNVSLNVAGMAQRFAEDSGVKTMGEAMRLSQDVCRGVEAESRDYVHAMRPIVDELYALQQEAIVAECCENVLSFSSTGEHVASLWRACIDTGAKGSPSAMQEYCKYLGAYSVSPDEEKVAMLTDEHGNEYIDFGSLKDYTDETGRVRTLVPLEYHFNTQDAVDIKTSRTGEVGSFMYYAIAGMPDMLPESLAVSKDIYQMILDAKRDGQQAKKNASIIDPLRATEQYGTLYGNIGVNGLEPDKWVRLDRRGKDAKTPMTPEQFVGQFRGIMASVGMDNVDPAILNRVGQAICDPELGEQVGMKARGAKMSSPGRQSSFNNDVVAVAIGAARGDTLLNEYDKNMYAPKSMRLAMEGTTQTEENFVPAREYVPVSVVGVSAQEMLEHEAQRERSIGFNIGDSARFVRIDTAPEQSAPEQIVETFEPVVDEQADTVADVQPSQSGDDSVLNRVFAEAEARPDECVRIQNDARQDVAEVMERHEVEPVPVPESREITNEDEVSPWDNK